MAIVLALSPVPLLALIMVLMAPGARRNAPGFLLGWFLGIMTISVITVMMPWLDTDTGEPSKGYGVMKLSLGGLFLILALGQLIRRKKAGRPDSTPFLFRKLDELTFWKSILAGFLFTGLNLKNIPLSAAGAAQIDLVLSSNADTFLILIVFALTGSLTVIIPVVLYLVADHRIDPVLLGWRKWLIRYNDYIIVFILVILAIIMFYQGLPASYQL